MVKNLPASAGDIRDTGSIHALGRSCGGGRGNLLQYSCPEDPRDRGAWWATVHGVTKELDAEATQHTHRDFILDYLGGLKPYPYPNCLVRETDSHEEEEAS